MKVPELSLTAMLADVLATDDATARARAVLALQGDLLAASASRLVAGTSEADDGPLARRALAEGHPVLDRRETYATVAVPLGDVDGTATAAIHRLERPSPLTLALAEERLTLTSMLTRRSDGGWARAAELATVLGGGGGGDALGRAAAIAATVIAADRVIVARLHRGVVRAVADTANPAPSAELAAMLRLAAGEVHDVGRIDGGCAPPGLARLTDGRRVHARAAQRGDHAVVIIAVDSRSPGQLAAVATLTAAVRPERRPVIPPALVAAGAANLPWPRNWPLARREAATRWAILLLPLAVLLLPVPTTVDAPATIVPLQQRVVTAPFDGRIASVAVHPGDNVRSNATVLLRLDARSAENERAEAVANLQAALAQAETAQIDGRADDERIARLRATQYDARSQILALQIASATIVAPLSGTVAGDDLVKRTGSPVVRGEPLMTVAAPGDYRVEIRVPDKSVGAVVEGQGLSLALKARPLERQRGRVTRIFPIAEVEEGDTVFRVVGTLDRGTALYAGMQGMASIATGWAPLGWLITRAPIRWLRLELWI